MEGYRLHEDQIFKEIAGSTAGLQILFLEPLENICNDILLTFCYDRFLCLLFLGGAPTSVYHFFCPSVNPSVRWSVGHNISGTVHHVIIFFCYACVKMIIFLGILFILLKKNHFLGL